MTATNFADRPAIAAFLAVVTLSLAGPLTKAIHLDSITLLAWRFILGYLSLLVIFPNRASPIAVCKLARLQPARSIGATVGFIGFVEPWTLSLRYIPLGLSVVLISMSSVIVYIVTSIQRKSFTARGVLGVSLGVLSVLAGAQGATDEHPHAYVGVILALGAAISAAGYYLLVASKAMSADPITCWALTSAAGAIPFFSISTATFHIADAMDPRQIGLLCALAIVVHAVGQGLVSIIAGSGNPTLAATTLLGEAFGTSVIAALWFHQSFGLGLLVTIACFGAAVLLLRNEGTIKPPPT